MAPGVVTVTVAAAPAHAAGSPSIYATLGTKTIRSGRSTTLTVWLDNTSGTSAAAGLGFRLNLPSAITINAQPFGLDGCTAYDKPLTSSSYYLDTFSSPSVWSLVVNPTSPGRETPGFSLPAGQKCRVQVELTASALNPSCDSNPASHTITSSDLVELTTHVPNVVDDTTPQCLIVTAAGPPDLRFTSPLVATNDTTPTISGAGAVSGNTVAVKGPGDATFCTTVATGATWSCTPTTAFAVGNVEISATQSDGTLASFPVTNRFAIDATPPGAPSVDNPASGALVASSPSIIWGSGEEGAKVTVTDAGGNTICNGEQVNEGTWYCNPTISLPAGLVVLTVTQADVAGNVSPSVTHAFAIGATRPAPIVAAPPANGFARSTTPTISGYGLTGATVTVKDASTATLCTATVVAGAWSCAPSTPLSQGVVTVTATQTVSGTVSPAATRSFTVDTTTPAAPVVTAPAEGSTTNTTTPAISGTGESNATVTVKDAANATVCTATVPDGSTTWSCTPSAAFAVGAVTLSTTQADRAGNTSTADTQSFTVADAPAAPVISAPAAGSATSDTTPTISGTGATGNTVTVKRPSADDPTICTATVVAGAWSCTPAQPFSDGSVTLTATQTDTSNNSSDATTRQFSVDTGAPAPPAFTSPINGSAFNSRTLPSILGTGEAASTVTVKLPDGATVCTALVTSEGSWGCDPTPQLEGPITWEATATDPAGNTSASSQVALTLDDTAPAEGVVTTPAEGSTTNDATPTIRGTGAEAGATVQVFYDRNRPACETVVTTAPDWSCTPSAPIAEGPRRFYAWQFDRAGNFSNAGLVKFSIDLTAPGALVITTPGSGDALTDNTPTITGSGGEAGATVTVATSTGAPVCTTTVGPEGAWICTPLVALPEGAVTLVATQTDGVGNTSAATNLDVFIDSLPPTAPVVSSPADRAKLRVSPSTISGTGESGSIVTVKNGSGATICSAEVSAAGTWSCTPQTALSDGSMSLTATQRDAAGHDSPSTTLTFTVDTTAPASPTAESTQDGSASPTLSGTGEPDATINVSGANGEAICAAQVSASGTWSCKPSAALPIGSQQLSVTQTDGAGNRSTTSVVLNVTVVAANAKIIGRVFRDLDRDGVADPDEPDISNVEVRLWTPGPDGVLGTGDDVHIQTATTHSPYVFEGLRDGTYRVEIVKATLPFGASATTNTTQDITIANQVDQTTTQQFGFHFSAKSLPVTGVDSEAILRWALLAVLLGGALVLITRRRRSPVSR